MTSPDNAPDAPPTAAEERTRWRAFAVAVSVHMAFRRTAVPGIGEAGNG